MLLNQLVVLFAVAGCIALHATNMGGNMTQRHEVLTQEQ